MWYLADQMVYPIAQSSKLLNTLLVFCSSLLILRNLLHGVQLAICLLSILHSTYHLLYTVKLIFWLLLTIKTHFRLSQINTPKQVDQGINTMYPVDHNMWHWETLVPIPDWLATKKHTAQDLKFRLKIGVCCREFYKIKISGHFEIAIGKLGWMYKIGKILPQSRQVACMLIEIN